MKTKTRHPFNLQSELSRLELNGACSYDGKPLILLEQAYCSYDCYHGIAQYVATAICPNEIAKDFTAPCYVVTWPIIRPSAENEEDACDWSAPDGLTPNGKYVWNAAIIIDVQLFALARNNHSLYNSIISQTVK